MTSQKNGLERRSSDDFMEGGINTKGNAGIKKVRNISNCSFACVSVNSCIEISSRIGDTDVEGLVERSIWSVLAAVLSIIFGMRRGSASLICDALASECVSVVSGVKYWVWEEIDCLSGVADRSRWEGEALIRFLPRAVCLRDFCLRTDSAGWQGLPRR